MQSDISDLSWRDTFTTALAVIGGVEVFAKFQDYQWWLIGSWKGALVTLGVIGLAMLLLNIWEMTDWHDWVNYGEAVLWIGAAVIFAVGLFTATQALFYILAAVLGVAWLAALVRHSWHATHHPTYLATH